MKVRQPFVVPQSICSHGDWENYDMHMAGCSKCGTMHLCLHATCSHYTNVEGHSICHITGLCTKMLNFSELEYVDTIQPLTVPQQHARVARTVRLSRKKRFRNIAVSRAPVVSVHPEDTQDVIHDVVHSCVHNILCSDQWVASNDIEYKRYTCKWSSSLTKVLRDFKKNTPGVLPTIPDIYSKTVASMGNTRVPLEGCLEDRSVLASWCTEKIRHHLMILQCNFPEIIQPSRMRGTVVGLMYLMRCGIIVKGIVVLPRLDILHDILPLETHLPHMFGIKGKVITETENTVKQVLKNMSVNELVIYGMPQGNTALRC
jgi:hypothetical protein